MLYRYSKFFMPATYRRIKGWTLVELSIVFVLITILISIAVPSWQSYIQRKQLQTAQQTIIDAINYARVIAIIRQQPVALCSPFDNWALGFSVVESQSKQNCLKASVIRQWQLNYQKKMTITWRGFGKTQQLSFYPNPMHWAVNGKFILSLGQQKPIHLIVNRLGKTRVE